MAEDERLVLDNRAAERTTEALVVDRRLGNPGVIGVPRICVQRIVLVLGVRRAI
jgi:hypothetical protein